MGLSLVVATYNDPLGLYMTVMALLQQLATFPEDWELIIAADGGSGVKWEKLPNVRCLRIRTGSPQGTRDAGIRAAKFNDVLCIESHVVVSDIKPFLAEHRRLGGAMTFPARVAEGAELYNVYGNETDFDGNLWFKKTLYQPRADKPYRVPQFGHSCFMLDRDEYLAIGGYTDLLKGWGYEEPFLCLRFWMLGKTCWQTPHVWHAHYLSDRGAGAAMVSPQFQENARILKYIVAGEQGSLQLTPELIAERQKICAGPFNGNLQALKNYFKDEGIIN
jgi:hypothetical protein